MSELNPTSDQAEFALGRPMCLLCFRPDQLCYCAYVRPISTRTRIEIVQHPREIFHPLNTARLVERSLENATVLRGDLRSLQVQVRAFAPSSRRFLLFPSAEARAVDELDPSAPPESIVVLDGTWPNARALLREIPELQGLPHVRLAPSAPSRYRIRRPPSFESLSTLESIALLFDFLEPEVDLQPLTELFERMIDLNIEARVPSRGGSRYKRRALRPHHFPELLTRSAANAILLHSEGVRPSGTARRIVGIQVDGRQELLPEQAPFEATQLRALLERFGSGTYVTWQPELRRALVAEGAPPVLLLRGIAADYLAHEERSRAASNTSIPPRRPLGTLEETLFQLGGCPPLGGDRLIRRLRSAEALWRLLLRRSAET